MTWIAFLSITKRIGYFLLDNRKPILTMAVLILACIGIASLGFCGKDDEPSIDHEEIRKEQESIANTETNKLNETLNQSNAAINAAMEPAKRAAENTEKAKQRKGNVSGEELDRLAREN